MTKSPLEICRPPSVMLQTQRQAHIANTLGDQYEAHQRGVIHRDVKASNIMLDQSGKPYIADFGIAKYVTSGTPAQEGAILGTPHYVSPEQAHGLDLDGRVDIYSLGVTLYALLTHRYPFQGKTAMSVIMKRLSQEPVPPQIYRPDLPPRLGEILDKTLEKDRRHRYQTTEQLADDLTDFVESTKNGHHSSVSKVSRLKPAPAQPKRRRAVSQWLTVTILVALSNFFLLVQYQDPATATKVKKPIAERVAQPETFGDEVFHKIETAQPPQVQQACKQLNHLAAKFKVGDNQTQRIALKAAKPAFGSLSAGRREIRPLHKKKPVHHHLKASATIKDWHQKIADLDIVQKSVAHGHLEKSIDLFDTMLFENDISVALNDNVAGW